METDSFLLEAFPGPAGMIHVNGEVIMANEELVGLGISPKMNVIGLLPKPLLDIYNDILTDLMNKQKTERFPKLYKEINFQDSFYVVYIGMQYGNIVFYAHNETRLRQSAETLVRDASIDPLTGLLNRRKFIKEVGLYVLPPMCEPYLIFFDIDHFKRVNDTYGHDAGDDILKYVAYVARSTIRSDDILARAGGEEFLIYGSCAHINNAYQLAERLRLAIAEKPATAYVQDESGTKKEVQVPITISAGIDFGHKQINELITNGDIALYTSKESGRNQTTIFKPGMVKK